MPGPLVPWKIQKQVKRFAKRCQHVDFTLDDCFAIRHIIGWSLVMFFDRLRKE